MSLTGDRIRHLRTFVTNTLRCCIIDHKEPNISDWLYCVSVLHGSAHVWSRSPDWICIWVYSFLCGHKQEWSAFFYSMKALQLQELLMWRVSAWSWNANLHHCLTACSSPTCHCKAQQGRYLLDTYLHVYKMVSSARLNCWAAAAAFVNNWMYLMSNVCLLMSVSLGSLNGCTL